MFQLHRPMQQQTNPHHGPKIPLNNHKWCSFIGPERIDICRHSRPCMVIQLIIGVVCFAVKSAQIGYNIVVSCSIVIRLLVFSTKPGCHKKAIEPHLVRVTPFCAKSHHQRCYWFVVCFCNCFRKVSRAICTGFWELTLQLNQELAGVDIIQSVIGEL